jgi:hypothetical protein
MPDGGLCSWSSTRNSEMRLGFWDKCGRSTPAVTTARQFAFAAAVCPVGTVRPMLPGPSCCRYREGNKDHCPSVTITHETCSDQHFQNKATVFYVAGSATQPMDLTESPNGLQD